MSGMLRLRPRGFRTQIVTSTVLLMAFVMIVLTAGTQAVLEWSSHNDVRRVLNERTQAALHLARATNKPLAAQSWAALEPLSRIFDSVGTPVGGSLQQAAQVLAEAELAVRRVRTVKLELTRQHIAALEAQAGGWMLPSSGAPPAVAAGLAPLLQELERLARYERRAFSRRKSALLQVLGLARASADRAPVGLNTARQEIQADANGGS